MWQKSPLSNFCVISFTTSLGRWHEQVLESFESLGMPSRNCFDLLVNTIVALACDRIPY